MAIAFRAAGAVVYADTITGRISLSAPPGTIATDIVLAVIYDNNGTAQTITPPVGWTLAGPRITDDTGQGMSVYWALGNVASYGFGLNFHLTSGDVVGFTLGYMGVDNITPMDAAAVGQVNASNTLITAPSITTVTANAWLIGFFGIGSESTFSAEFGAHRQSGAPPGSGESLDAADAAQAVAGPSGTKTVTASIAARSIGVLAALRPAETHWGVDSITHADDVDPMYPPGQKFFDVVTTQAGSPPEFWGRYIGSPRDSDNLKKGEIDYLHSRNCRILLIYNGETATTVGAKGTKGFRNGEAAAIKARDAARNLGVPEDGTVWIYCDIESSWSPTANFLSGWFQTIQASSRYGAGVYGTTSNAFNAAYCAAYAPTTPPEYLYNTQPQRLTCDWTYRVFGPNLPTPCNASTVIHQYKINCPVAGAPSTKQVDLDLANGFGFQTMWVPSLRWEAFLIDGHVQSIISQVAGGVRSVEVMSSGRIYAMFMGFRVDLPQYYKLWMRHSDNGGETWAQDQSLNQSGGGSTFAVYHGLVERNGLLDCYWKDSNDTANIWRSTYNGSSWSPQVSLTAGNTLRVARSRDRSKRGMIYTSGGWQFLPVMDDGSPGAIETVHSTEINANTTGLIYDEQNRPVVIMVDTFNNRWLRKVRDPVSGWPAAFEEFPLTDPITNPEEFFQGVGSATPWSWGQFETAFADDAHGLKHPVPGSTSFVFTWRRRVNGTWYEESVDFASLDKPITGGDAVVFSGSMMPMWFDTTSSAAPQVCCVVWANDGGPSGGQFWTLWFLRARLL